MSAPWSCSWRVTWLQCVWLAGCLAPQSLLFGTESSKWEVDHHFKHANSTCEHAHIVLTQSHVKTELIVDFHLFWNWTKLRIKFQSTLPWALCRGGLLSLNTLFYTCQYVNIVSTICSIISTMCDSSSTSENPLKSLCVSVSAAAASTFSTEGKTCRNSITFTWHSNAMMMTQWQTHQLFIQAGQNCHEKSKGTK